MRKKGLFFALMMAGGLFTACDSSTVSVNNQGDNMKDSTCGLGCEVAVDSIVRVGEGPIWDY